MRFTLRIFVCICAAACMISACTGPLYTPPDQEDIGNTGPPAAQMPLAEESSIAIFPHMPVPFELEKIGSETVVFTTPEFHGGIFTLKGSISQESVMDFFLRRLPEEGWKLAGRLESETGYMAFINASGGSCLIQISSINMGFSTEVRIFVSEGGRQSDVIR